MGTPIFEYKEQIEKYGEVECDVIPGVMVIMEDDKGVVQAVDFLCPCGCGSECFTPIVTPDRPRPQDRPVWDFSRGPNGPTLSPSIKFTGGCRAHFHIIDGKTNFCGDSGK